MRYRRRSQGVCRHYESPKLQRRLTQKDCPLSRSDPISVDLKGIGEDEHGSRRTKQMANDCNLGVASSSWSYLSKFRNVVLTDYQGEVEHLVSSGRYQNASEGADRINLYLTVRVLSRLR